MPADAAPVADFHRFVRGVAQRGGAAACAVRGLDYRSVGARMPAGTVYSQAAVPALRRNSGAGPADGHQYLLSAENDAAAARSQPAPDDDADAAGVYHHVP